MGVTVMRILVIAGAVLMLSLPTVAPSRACEFGQSAQAATTTYSAEEAKPAKKNVVKKVAKVKKEKVEYMRAAPMEPPKK
jgi:hypothetical protein